MNAASKPGRVLGTMASSIFGLLAPALLGSAVLGLTGCDQAPEEQLETAAEDLEEAREQVAQENVHLEMMRRSLDAEEAKVRAARSRLHEAEEAELTAEERVRRRASDVALFRSIQTSLLEDDALREDAVFARVEGRVVTLEGAVGSEDVRARAIEIAEQTPGVGHVRDAMEVEKAEPAGGSTP